MKKTFEIGPGLRCDVDRLVASRLLVQANSGGGKTRTLRRLLEQSHGRLQHLVVDPEGEYHTLREHFDYVLAAPSGGDTVAHPRTAAMLAERLLQLNVSAILDIYELNPDQRTLFVQRFLEALVNAPRDLWHPVLVVLDEAHVYAPEGSQSVSATAVKAMASRGRKRGFCLVPATQRLSKLSKDVAAECNNKLVGRCTLDVDIKRAAEELGFTTNDQRQALRLLEPGQFYAYGPAFDVKAPVLVHVGSVQSSHPEPGQKAAPVPAPTEKVRKVLQQLADLPAEAEEREKSIKELKAEIVDLRRKVQAAGKQSVESAPVRQVKEVPALTDADRALIENLASQIQTEREALLKQWADVIEQGRQAVLQAGTEAFSRIITTRAELEEAFEKRLEQKSVKKLLDKLNGLAVPQVPGSRFPVPPAHASHQTAAPRTATAAQPRQSPRVPAASNGHSELKAMHRAMLTALAQHPDGLTKKQILVHTGYASSGPVSTAFADLAREGYALSEGNRLRVTDGGLHALGDYEPLPTGDALRQWLLNGNKLSAMEKALLGAICEAYPDGIKKGAVLERTGYASSGPVSSAFAKLVAYNYAIPQGASVLKAAEELFG